MPQAQPNNPPADKKSWRTRLTARCAAMTQAQRITASAAITQAVLGTELLQPGAAVLAYAATPTEVQTHALIQSLLDMDVRVALPVITGKHTMTAVIITSLNDLAPDAYGIPAPEKHIRTPENTCKTPDIILVPGMGFDQHTGHRLGRGAGYYDRYLAERPEALTIGLAFDEQVVTKLSAESHDIPMRLIITPTQTLRFK